MNGDSPRLARVLALGAFALWAGCSDRSKEAPPPTPQEVEAVSVRSSEFRTTGEYLGALLSRQSVTVMPQVAGYVRRIHVRPGQQVGAGQPLVDVDARERTAALESAQAEQHSAQVNLDLARRTRARTESLFKEGLASAQELERAVATVDAAEAVSRSATAQVAQRDVLLGFNVVRAPFAGTVGEVRVRVGDMVSATTALTSVAQADVLEVSVAVPGEQARALAPDTPLEVLDAQGRVLITRPIFYVAPQADPSTQLVEVMSTFQNTVGLRPSELVRARLVFATRQALQLPAVAVVRQSGQPFVLVLGEKDGQTLVERRPVTLGTLGEGAYVVKSGLRPGDRVAVSSLQSLRDGAPVTVKARASEARTEPDAGLTGGRL
ncbi:efflux RND transporter periplasmic adaptor subunit [Myxococcus sp. 1LA]